MQIDLNNLNPGVFFPFDPTIKDSGGVTLRPCDGEALRKIEKKITTKRTEFRRGRAYDVVKTNDELRDDLIWDFSIVSWEKLLDTDGKEIPCDLKHKRALMLGSVWFAGFVGECMEQLNKASSELRELQEKNSKSTA